MPTVRTRCESGFNSRSLNFLGFLMPQCTHNWGNAPNPKTGYGQDPQNPPYNGSRIRRRPPPISIRRECNEQTRHLTAVVTEKNFRIHDGSRPNGIDSLSPLRLRGMLAPHSATPSRSEWSLPKVAACDEFSVGRLSAVSPIRKNSVQSPSPADRNG